MERPLPYPCVYEIRVRGELDEDWAEWFPGLAIHIGSQGVTVLRGPIRDQAALFGVLNRLNGLNLAILSIRQFDR